MLKLAGIEPKFYAPNKRDDVLKKGAIIKAAFEKGEVMRAEVAEHYSLDALARQYGCSRSTIRRAIREAS